MADLDEDVKTSETSNLDEPEDQTGSVEQVDETKDGQASDDETTTSTSDAEGDKKTRGEARHERYIDKLSAEIRESNDRSTHYTDELFAPKPYQPLEFKDGAEYDPSQLEEDRKTVSANKFAEGVQTGLHQGTTQVAKELWADRFEGDSERVTAKYKALDSDPDNDQYDPKLEASLVQKYIQFTGVEKDANGRITIQKPNIRFKDFVDAEMQNLEDYAARRGDQASKNVASQRAKGGVRPNGQGRPSSGGHGFDENDPVGSVARMTQKQYMELGGREASDAYLAKRGLAPKV